MADLASIQDRFRSFIYLRDVHAMEWFEDFDRLRSGRVSVQQFHRVFDTIRFLLNDQEFEVLSQAYLEPDGKVNPIASIMVTVLAEMANIERSNIQYRLNSGRANYIANGGKLGRKRGSTKSEEKLREEYKETIMLLKKGYSVRNTAKLQGIGISTVQRIKNQFINNK